MVTAEGPEEEEDSGDFSSNILTVFYCNDNFETLIRNEVIL